MRYHLLVAVSLFTVAVPAERSVAQVQQSGRPLLTEQSLFSLYAARHDATVRFAELGANGASDKGVRKFAKRLIEEHQKAAAKLRQAADKNGVELRHPGRDTTDLLLANATKALEGKSGDDFDAAFVIIADDWLSALMMNNGKTVTRRLPEGELKQFAQAHTTFLFHERVEMGKLLKKYRRE